MVHPITVTIITRDEEDRIAGAVASAAWANEVLVVDSGSTDRTVEVAAGAGARVVVEPWRGYGGQKNRAAELARTDWVFSVDADERISSELARLIEAVADHPAVSAYRVRRRNHFASRPIRHWPWAWDTTVRLYDRRRASFSEPAVHETLLCDGEVGAVAGILDHFSYRDWEDYWRRQRRYAQLGAEVAAVRGRRRRPGDLSARPLATFVRHWISRGYLLGGRLGWQLSWAAARGTRLKYLLIEEIADREA